MPTIEKFTHDMIKKYLDSKDLRYLRDRDDDFLVQFGYDDRVGGSLDVWLMAEGPQKTIYHIRVSCDRPVAKADWGKAINLCNTWNKERRWPKSYLVVRDPSTDSHGSIYVEEQINLESGIHQELLDDFTDTTIATAFAFWEWLHREQGM